MKKILITKQNNNDDNYIINDILPDRTKVESGDVLYSLETSKTVVEEYSEFSGFFIVNPNIKNEDTVVVGQLLAVISENKNESYNFESKGTKKEEKNPDNFTKSAYKYAVENDLDISDFSSEELVTLDMLKEKNEFFNDKLNKPKIAIVGASGHGLEILKIINSQSSFEFVGFIDIKYPNEKKYFDYKIIGNDDSYDEIYKKGIHNIVIVAGWLKETKKISNIFKKASSVGFNFPNIIHETAVISENVRLGSGIQILSNVFIGPNVFIDDGCVINNGSIVSHDSNLGKFIFVAPGAVIAGNVKVGNYVVLGINSSTYLRKEVPDYFILENNKSYNL